MVLLHYGQESYNDDQTVQSQHRLVDTDSVDTAVYHQLAQWSTRDGKCYVPVGKTVSKIAPGAYEIKHSDETGIYFESIPVLTTGLIRFPDANSEAVIKEIQTFWDRADVFREYNITHKRGIILWGPPGSGKSCTIRIVMKDVISRDGVVVKFGHPPLFLAGIRLFRIVQPDTPLVVLMEDIDATIEAYNESTVLNILDGIDQIENVVFIATTNYPERLGARIINRPSRFDKRYKIGHPNDESRELYLTFLIGRQRIVDLDINISQWVQDTDGYSLAHLKELFTSVIILGDSYVQAIQTLTNMREKHPDSSEDELRAIGFNVRPAPPARPALPVALPSPRV